MKTLIILLIIFFLYKIYQLSLEKNLLRKVSWCIADGNSSIRCLSPLIHFIQLDYIELNDVPLRNIVDISYRLNINDDNETNHTILLLEAYQNELAKKFHEGQLKINYKLSRMSEEEYFMLSLCTFLGKHQYAVSFCDQEMYTLLECKYYSPDRYDTTYELTSFGRTYTKLYLLTQVFCENSKKTQTHCGFNISPKLRERLDSNKITISHL